MHSGSLNQIGAGAKSDLEHSPTIIASLAD